MLILFVCNIDAQWSQCTFDVVLNFSFLETCGNVYVATLVKILHGGFLLQHLQREVALSDGWRSSLSQFSNPEMAGILSGLSYLKGIKMPEKDHQVQLCKKT